MTLTDKQLNQLERQMSALRKRYPVPPGLKESLLASIPDDFPDEQGNILTRIPRAATAGIATVLIAAAVTAMVFFTGTGVQRSVAKVVEPLLLAASAAPGVHMTFGTRDTGIEEFDHIDLKGDLIPMEVWIRWPVPGSDPKQPPTDPGRMRVEKQGRIYAYDGTTATYSWPALNQARQVKDARPRFDAFWPAAWLEKLMDLPRGCKILEQREAGGEGILRIGWPAPKGEAPVWRGWFRDFEREIEVRWSLETKQLTSLRRWVMYEGQRVLVTESTSIQYMPLIGDDIFQITLPEGVRFCTIPPAPSPEIDALGPREAAERFFAAAIAGDWETVELFCPTPNTLDWLKAVDPAELLLLGQPFTKESYDGVYIPYELRSTNAKKVKKLNLAMINKNQYGRWVVDGGI
jgi:hypothetical protein